MSKFSQGPWKIVSVKTDDNTPMLSIQEDCGQEDDPDLSICGIYNVTDKAIANAQLIIASPDLVKALQNVMKCAKFGVERYGYDPETDDDILFAEFAINKALGKVNNHG